MAPLRIPPSSSSSSSPRRDPENPFAQPEDLNSNQKNSQTSSLDRITQLELIKLLLPSSLALVAALFITNQNSAGESPPTPYSWLSPFMAVVLCIGLVAMFYGLIYAERYPTVSSFAELVGLASVLLAFFIAMFGVLLPPSLYWFPLLCWLLIVAPYIKEVIDRYRSQKVSDACVSLTGPTSNRSTSTLPA
ncbi:hypothetical protein CCACVL1_06376 [Corchorus capsularis]|uniref:Transmembrane protein n=1 Tax=Corchorus capsularis TaxID=210143 RepID=A0A1R3JFU4_COCAP|nr:hypothetical protein CCACVL1_06376 [Corchorus capsularis]